MTTHADVIPVRRELTGRGVVWFSPLYTWGRWWHVCEDWRVCNLRYEDAMRARHYLCSVTRVCQIVDRSVQWR